MRGLFLFLVVCAYWLSVAVGCTSKRHEEETPVPEEVVEQRVKFEERLLAEHLTGPYVISRDEDGQPEHEGEGILWGGVARYALSCDIGVRIDDALIEMVTRRKGALVRFEPLGEYAHGREITWDGAVGFYLAVADSITRCGGAEKWREPFALHLKYLEDHYGELYEGTGSTVPPGYDTIRVLIAFALGLRDAPTPDAVVALEAAVAGTLTTLASDTERPCYLANLAYLSMLTGELLGEVPSGPSREIMCKASEGFDMPTWDHFCGRRHMKHWLEDFKENEWEFRHQRCGSREKPDGQGFKTPAVDWLLGVVMAHGR